MKSFVIKSLLEYENCVRKVNKALIIDFNLTCSPLMALRNRIIPKIGFLSVDGEEIQFVFHGVGCSISIGNKIIDFDYAKTILSDGTVDYQYKYFDDFQLFQFIKSLPESMNNSIDEESYKKILADLEDDGYIVRIEDYEIECIKRTYTKWENIGLNLEVQT